MNKEQQTRRRIKQALDRQAPDDQTRAALRAARLKALDGSGSGAPARWLAASAVAVLLLAVAGLLLQPAGDGNDPLPALTADELAVIASEDELELLEEYEFYLWFAEDKNV